MGKFIVIMLLAIVIAKFLNIFFGEENVGDGVEKVFVVTAESGILGCLSKEKFDEAAANYEKQDFDAVKKLIAAEICFFFKKGEELSAPKNTCSEGDADNDLFHFSSKRFKVVEPYLPCFAVR